MSVAGDEDLVDGRYSRGTSPRVWDIGVGVDSPTDERNGSELGLELARELQEEDDRGSGYEGTVNDEDELGMSSGLGGSIPSSVYNQSMCTNVSAS